MDLGGVELSPSMAHTVNNYIHCLAVLNETCICTAIAQGLKDNMAAPHLPVATSLATLTTFISTLIWPL
jgi:hypothetical protein